MRGVATVLGLALATAPHAAAGQAVPDAHWLLQYQGDTLPEGGYAVNKLIWDKRFQPFFRHYLRTPQAFWDKGDSLFKVARTFLGVPGRADLSEGRYWSAYGCVPHDCADTGLLWVDVGSRTPLVIFSALDPDPTRSNRDRLLLFPSKNLQLEKLPPQFRARVTQFAAIPATLGHTITAPLSTVTLVAPNGTKHEYDPAKLMASGMRTGVSAQP